MPDRKARLIIIEDLTIVADAFASSLQGPFEVLKTFDNAEDALTFLHWNSVDIVLSDICLKEKNFLDDLPRFKQNYPRTKVILMTGYPEISFFKRAEEEGADSFLYKNASLDEAIAVINDVAAGHPAFPQEPVLDEKASRLQKLTPHEMEVLRMICRCKDRKEVAELTHYSENTIKFYIASILAKTGFSSIGQTAIYVVGHGLIVPSVDP